MKQGYNFPYIAERNEFRSTLKTNGNLEWQSSTRLSARYAARTKGCLRRFFPCDGPFRSFGPQKNNKKDYKKNIQQQFKDKSAKQYKFVHSLLSVLSPFSFLLSALCSLYSVLCTLCSLTKQPFINNYTIIGCLSLVH